MAAPDSRDIQGVIERAAIIHPGPGSIIRLFWASDYATDAEVDGVISADGLLAEEDFWVQEAERTAREDADHLAYLVSVVEAMMQQRSLWAAPGA